MKSMFGVLLIAISAMIPVPAVSIDEVTLRFLPPETQSIAHIDVAGLRNAPLVKESLEGKTSVYPRDWQSLGTKAGIDLERDVDNITFAKLNARDSLVVVQGRFDRFKLEEFLKSEGRASHAYLGHTLYADADKAIVALDNVVLTGHTNAVKKALDQRQLPGSLPLRNDLLAAIDRIGAGNQVWGAGDFSINDLGNLGVRGPAPVLDMMKSLRSGTFELRADTGIHIRATGTFADDESAKNIGDLARGLLAIAKLQSSKQQPDIAQLLDGIQVSNSGKTVSIQIEESGEQLKRLGNLPQTIQRNLR